MDTADPRFERLKAEWTDQLVEVAGDRPELARFNGLVGRVVTVNFNGKALVDFADGGWYDIAASEQFLRKLPPDDEAARKKYDAKANSAQIIPTKQG